jgi:hypothetical protein
MEPRALGMPGKASALPPPRHPQPSKLFLWLILLRRQFKMGFYQIGMKEIRTTARSLLPELTIHSDMQGLCLLGCTGLPGTFAPLTDVRSSEG